MRGRYHAWTSAPFWIAAALLTLGACADTQSSDTTPAPPPTSTIPPATPTALDNNTGTPPSTPATTSRLVRVTGDVLERARQYGLVAPTGEYVGPVDHDGNPLIFEPIDGYGDFSNTDLFEVDPTEIVSAQARCVQDQGFPVEVDASESGFSFERVPPEQNQIAFAVAIACKEGLNLPPPSTPTVAQREEQLAYLTLVVSCLRELGFAVEDPPSLDEFIELDGAWSPYDALPPLGPAEFDRVDRSCPQWPPGGYGAWEPGDPLRPRP